MLARPSPAPSESLPPPLPDVQNSSQAWIAGPVAGGITVLALILLGLGHWRRRRKLAAPADFDDLNLQGAMFHKPELHSEYVMPHHEMEGAWLSSRKSGCTAC